MSQILPRFDRHAEQIESERRVAKAILESGGTAPPPLKRVSIALATLGGDPIQLRGIPAIGRGVGGATAGSSPGRGQLFSESVR